jgi:integrase
MPIAQNSSAKTFKTIASKLKKNEKPVRPFVLYSLRHTFLTRLGESGCDVWTLERIAGHSSIQMSSRYVHPGNDAVVDAMLNLGGHKIGHSAEIVISTTQTPRQLNR